MPLEDIPQFLSIPQADRDAEWQKHRVPAKPLVPIKHIPIPPGATDDETDPDT